MTLAQLTALIRTAAGAHTGGPVERRGTADDLRRMQEMAGDRDG